MVYNQIYPIINSINSQMAGESAITVTDLTGLIAMGKSVLSSSTSKEKFLNILCDRIARTNIRTLDVELDFPKMMVNPFEYGALIQKINIQPLQAKAQKSWQISEDGFTPNQYDIDTVSVSQTFFEGTDTWEFDWTIPDKLLNSAFTSEVGFVAFVEGIMKAASDSMVMSLNNMAYLALDNFIGSKLIENNGIVNVLDLYNAQFPNDTLTQDTAFASKEFARFFTMTMRNYERYLAKPSTKYNVAGMYRTTKRDNMHILMNSAWSSMLESYLYSDVYYNDYVKAPTYAEYVCLQGVEQSTNNWKNDTSIKIKTSDGDSVEINGVVACMIDREAVFTGYEDMFTATDRNNRNRYTNYTSGCTKMYANDLSENGIIFIVNDYFHPDANSNDGE